MQYDLQEDNLAISPNGEVLTRLPANYRTLCTKADVYWCPPTFPLYTKNLDSCIFALYNFKFDEADRF